MSRAREKTLDGALARALRETSGSVRVARAANIAFTLPASLVEDEAGVAARVAVVDEQTLEATVGPLLAGAPGEVRVVVVAPISREGGRGLASRLSTRVRRLTPVDLEDVCEALRHASVIDVRVVDVDGPLGLAVLTGRTTLG